MKTKYPKLPVKFKEKWLKALRSGEYKQGEGYLLINNTLCCLGVGCKVLNIPDKNINNWGSPSKGLDKRIPNYLIGGRGNEYIDELMEMNDNDGKSFKQIANWIEANL